MNAFGIKRVGELSITGTATAIANIVFKTTGIRVCDLPITLGKLLAHLPTALA